MKTYIPQKGWVEVLDPEKQIIHKEEIPHEDKEEAIPDEDKGGGILHEHKEKKKKGGKK